MSDTARQKPFPKAVLIFIVIGVVCLGIIFALLATIGDDVPNELPPASESSAKPDCLGAESARHASQCRAT